jgi:hypothetical protein
MPSNSWSCRCTVNLSSFWLQIKKCLFLVSTAILDGGQGLTIQGPPPPTRFALILFNGFRGGDFKMTFRKNQLNLHIFVSAKPITYMSYFPFKCICLLIWWKIVALLALYVWYPPPPCSIYSNTQIFIYNVLINKQFWGISI